MPSSDRTWNIVLSRLSHPDDASDGPMKRHYVLLLVFEAIVVALLWIASRAFA